MKNLLDSLRSLQVWVILPIFFYTVGHYPDSVLSLAQAEDKEKIETHKPPEVQGEAKEEPSQTRSERSESKGDLAREEAEGKKETGDSRRQFLRLAEPKKAAPPKRSPWGGYWSAIYGEKSLDEEDAEKKEESNPPEADTDVSPPPLSEYKEVDFGKFASGSYAQEYENKYVKMRCKFLSLAPEGARLVDFLPPDYANFVVTGTATSMTSLTVAARTEKADKVFALESQKEIVLYGKARRVELSRLTLVVEEIEVKK